MFVADKHAYPLAAIEYPDRNSLWMGILSQAELDDTPTLNNTPAHYPPPGIWHCPSASMPKTFPWYPDYGYNSYGMSAHASPNALGLGGNHIWIGGRQQAAPPINDSEVAVPSEMMAIGDGFKGANGVLQDGWFFLWRTEVTEAQGTQDTRYIGSTKRAFSRHQGQANVMYCDGHIESPKLKFLFDDTTDKALVRWNRDHKPHRELLPP
jgi:prepilin-type processing-associated H-X9-DG protein